MNRTQSIELPEEVFITVSRLAAINGVTPAEWVESQIPRESIIRNIQQPLSVALQGIIGAIDSTKKPQLNRPFSLVSDQMADKFRKQGLNIP